MPVDPFPIRLLSDPAGDLIRKAGAVRASDKRGFIARPSSMVVDRSGIVRWLYAGDGSPADRPGPTRLAIVAEAVSRGKPLPEQSPALSLQSA